MEWLFLIDMKILESKITVIFICFEFHHFFFCVCLWVCLLSSFLFHIVNWRGNFLSFFYWFECEWHLRLIPLYQSYKLSIIKRRMKYQLFWLLLTQYVWLRLVTDRAHLLGNWPLFHQMPSMVRGYIFGGSKSSV